jgi:predicted transglutaminase-like protease
MAVHLYEEKVIVKIEIVCQFIPSDVAEFINDCWTKKETKELLSGGESLRFKLRKTSALRNYNYEMQTYGSAI